MAPQTGCLPLDVQHVNILGGVCECVQVQQTRVVKRQFTVVTDPLVRPRACRTFLLVQRFYGFLDRLCSVFLVSTNCGLCNGVFTLPNTEANAETDRKWVVKNFVEVFILHTDTGFCVNLSLSVSVSM